MNQEEILTRLGLALAIGFLIGIERGWQQRQEEEGERAAGLRTFALIGLFGGFAALLGLKVGEAAFAFSLIALAAIIAAFRWRELEREGRFGVTTVVAALITFALGAYAVVGEMVVAAAAAVVVGALLAAKAWLHAWLKALSWRELRAAIILLAMTFVALPVLPNRGFGPYEALNPYALWLMTIVIAAVSFAGYVAVKMAGERYGPLLTGIAGGVVSSTATTLALARFASANPSSWRAQLGGALAASAVMFVRVGVIVAVFGPYLLPRLVWPLAAAGLVTVAAGTYFSPPWVKPKGEVTRADPAEYRNPFELRSILGFGVLLAVVVFLTKAFTATLGNQSAIALAAVAGIADVDAITLSMTDLGRSATSIAEIGILVAVAANSLSKSFLAMVAGGRRFGFAYLTGSLAALVAGGLAALAVAGLS